ncbi:hypothetical protein RND71_028391 [Anisodus tanguticus]|uniref:Uncharacterized protein n=1 Tax=Anisodus tanguticus TaxID=243964 RepID=A0AAE1RJK6_9SOLA|nr:hypothetical protein RND71_028391 [Anisodus tanguticus]
MFQLEEFTVSKCTHFQMLPRFLYYQKELRSLDLSKNQFRGKLPIWLLENNTQLEEFRLSGNDFIGSFNLPSHAQPNIKSVKGHIPSGAWDMKHLQALDLSHNQFSGELPTEPAIPPLLARLHLDTNKLIGEIPKSLFSISLVSLDISQDSLSGMIPLWMGEMSRLSVLTMSHNQLQGLIPMELCNLSILQFLNLSHNQFSGWFPFCFNHLGSLEHLFLNMNLLGGNLTHVLLDNSNLLTLDLSNNKFIGSIPQWIGDLSTLNILFLKRNQFEGEIPNHQCHLQILRMTDLSHNKLTGSIPRCLASSNSQQRGRWRNPPGHQVRM